MEQIQSIYVIMGYVFPFILPTIPLIFYIFVERQFERTINKANSVNEAKKWRRKIRIFRFLILCIITPTLLFLNPIIMNQVNIRETFTGDSPYLIIMIGLGIYSMKMWSDIKRVSTLTIDDVLNMNKYGLYLRAFDEDWKSHDFESFVRHRKIPKISFPYFIESAFIGSFRNIVAVGIPNEVESCGGAQRVYLEDDSWQSDVIQLISKAQFIIVLISNKESCIWELCQLKNHLEKTVFIVKDISVYESVRCKVEGQLPLPKLENDLSKKKLCLAITPFEPFIREFENTLGHYDLVTEAIATHFHWKKKLFHYI